MIEGFKITEFRNQLLINPRTKDPQSKEFCEPGDSRSLVCVQETKEVVSLLHSYMKVCLSFICIYCIKGQNTNQIINHLQREKRRSYMEESNTKTSQFLRGKEFSQTSITYLSHKEVKMDIDVSECILLMSMVGLECSSQ